MEGEIGVELHGDNQAELEASDGVMEQEAIDRAGSGAFREMFSVDRFAEH